MPKVFLNYDQQIEKLKNDKNLLVENETYAKEVLMNITGVFEPSVRSQRAMILEFLEPLLIMDICIVMRCKSL